MRRVIAVAVIAVTVGAACASPLTVADRGDASVTATTDASFLDVQVDGELEDAPVSDPPGDASDAAPDTEAGSDAAAADDG